MLFLIHNISKFLSPTFEELETKRILLDIFKEKQQKSAAAGTIPSFYKKACISIVTQTELLSYYYMVWIYKPIFAFTLPLKNQNLCFLLFQKPEEGSISSKVQRLAKCRFLKVLFGFVSC